MKQITKKFKVDGMHCTNCENLIHKRLMALEGVHNAKIDYVSQKGEVNYDSEKIDFAKILETIEKEGYSCCLIDPHSQDKNNANKNNSNTKSDYVTIDKKTIGIIFAIIGFIAAIYFILKITENIAIPQISQNMGYGLLFLVGLLTGFHCIAMCGGFVVSYTAKDAQEGRKSYMSHIKYGLGKTISYTIIGAIFGLIGSIIAFTPVIRGVAGIIAGLFLVIFGLNMLNVFPFLRNIRIRSPNSVNKFVGKTSQKHNSPLIIGLLNGLMIACGPLQAIYIMAAGTGSMIEGAKLLFIFGLGTLPVLLSFGFITSLISSKATHRILKASGAIVIILGLIMLNRGLALTGSGFDINSIISTTTIDNPRLNTNSDSVNSGDISTNEYQEIRMDVTSDGYEPNKFVLKKGVPVRWIITGKEITSCNGEIVVPKLGLDFKIKKGEQVIEFTPTEEGTIPWSCWMGMLKGTFIVKENIDINDKAAIQKTLETVQTPKGGSCGGGSGGGCGCGMMG